jgi:hypothetical protein
MSERRIVMKLPIFVSSRKPHAPRGPLDVPRAIRVPTRAAARRAAVARRRGERLAVAVGVLIAIALLMLANAAAFT